MLIKFHHWLTADQDVLSDEKQVTKQLAIYCALVNAITHSTLAIIFYWLGASFLTFYNIVVVFYFLGLGVLAKKNALNIFWILCAGEFVLHQWLATMELGQLANFHLYIMVSVGLWFLLSARLTYKLGLTLFSTVSMIALTQTAPLYPSEKYDIETISANFSHLNNFPEILYS